jgi:hypothetical protein
MSIRTMSRADVQPAAEAVRRGGWGERGPFFAFAVDHTECVAIVAEMDGEIVGTGVGRRPAPWAGSGRSWSARGTGVVDWGAP